MSVESEILRIQHNIADTYAKVSEKGGDVPLQPNSENLAAAVASIPAGGGAIGYQWWSPQMTSNTTPSPYSASASSSYDANYQPFQAFDGTDKFWHSKTFSNEWLQIDLGKPLKIAGFSMTAPITRWNEMFPKHFTLNGSNDGTAWTQIEEFSLTGTISASEVKEFSLEKSVSYRYYRINILQIFAAAQTYAAIGDIRFKKVIDDSGGGSVAYLVKSPVGTIVIWSGTADNIPAGWQLCDGTNGTPDLRDKFVLGAGTNHAVGETGGSEEVTLTVAQMPSHTHSYARYIGTARKYSSGTLSMYDNSNTRNENTGEAGGSQPHPNMPPYYALCYIMKLTADETDGVTMDQVNSAIDTKLDTYEPQEVYSTEETRIGTWIDGKPLYRKVVSTTTSSTTDQWTVVTSINNADVHLLQACVVDTFGSSVFIPFMEDSTGICLYTKAGVVYIKFFGENASYYVNRPIILDLEYTKNTDQAQTTAASTVLKALSKAPALNSIQSAAVTASGAEEIEI